MMDILLCGLGILLTMMAAACGAFMACALHLAKRSDES